MASDKDEPRNVQDLILAQLNMIAADVRKIPGLEARIAGMRDSTQQLETAMRETTAGLRMQAEAHGKLIGELQLQVHQAVAGMMGISNDMQGLMGRVKDLEKQIGVTFQQQMMLAREVREAGVFPDPEEYKKLKDDVGTLPGLRTDICDIRGEIKKIDVGTLPDLRIDVSTIKGEIEKHRPWVNGIEWFLLILFYALASTAVVGVLWLLGQALTNGL